MHLGWPTGVVSSPCQGPDPIDVAPTLEFQTEEFPAVTMVGAVYIYTTPSFSLRFVFALLASHHGNPS